MRYFNLPDLGEGLPDAEIQEWYVKVGDNVEAEQPLAAMETAKAVVDVPSPFAGKIAKLFGEPGDTIETGDPLVGFEASEEVANTSKKEDQGTVVGRVDSQSTILADDVTISSMTTTPSDSLKVLPAVRATAKKLGVNLANVKGTGPSGQITINDVKSFTGSNTSGQIQEGYEVLKGFRRTMCQQMTRSNDQVVHTTVFEDALIGHWAAKTDITVRILQAIVAACKAEPALNSHFDGDAIAVKRFSDINLGLAVDTENGLFVPVIEKLNSLDAGQMRDKINEFKDKVLTKSISPEEMQGATITLSNFGTICGRYATPMIVPPAVAIIGVGRLHDSVVAIDGKPEVRRAMPISLTFDHRVITGGEAARFLKAVINSLET